MELMDCLRGAIRDAPHTAHRGGRFRDQKGRYTLSPERYARVLVGMMLEIGWEISDISQVASTAISETENREINRRFGEELTKVLQILRES